MRSNTALMSFTEKSKKAAYLMVYIGNVHGNNVRIHVYPYRKDKVGILTDANFPTILMLFS
jgi:hypothetical protein